MKIVVASNNKKKRAEIQAILGALGIELVSPEQTISVEVVEDADSFAGNAKKKADAFAKANGTPALADDSGLCVDVLNGAPGIYSARFAGENATDADNNIKLLADLNGTEERSAHFVCALHLAFPDSSSPLTAEGSVDGSILRELSGNTGFGYDPLFYCPELGKAFADSTPEEKASVSHRGRALRAMAERLKNRV
ncbi:RdgB/HAM1 family non-canonical purine NTP pyrophosphatase [Mariprofundus sp. NF]|uniref:RdgB/HAM1 family non-canonical purine NTP pyrophosphatase n=1 Tax=Mariprofundus sp. NF TaxID=2608716 RepID=UPI0015A148F3|nr:RdgB/HAM1 family non-canonical purine NTP pyrophosphatase [Mariprofundus sp. NF]NWF37730.1 RdgB/HAM1 family non-canonical purine NTP pyrophosphatase [Mariprofundus sp. NF]